MQLIVLDKLSHFIKTFKLNFQQHTLPKSSKIVCLGELKLTILELESCQLFLGIQANESLMREFTKPSLHTF